MIYTLFLVAPTSSPLTLLSSVLLLSSPLGDDDSSTSRRSQPIDQFGPLFSVDLHKKGGMYVLHEKADNKTMSWKSVDSKNLSSMGLTSGVRKVYSMIEKFKQNKSKPIPGKARKKKKS
ncbi:hypothetical protein CsSME_00012886 [Camellia sinensis var. sinensis]